MIDKNNIYLTPVQVDIREINSEPGPFSMSFEFDLADLLNSIEKIGILNPPFVIKGRSETMEIVTGFRRIHALKKLGWDSVACIDLSNAGYSDLELLLLNLHENLTIREFNDVEKSMVLIRLLRYMPRDDIEKMYVKILKINKPADLDLLVRVDKFDPAVKKSIADRKISLSVAGILSGMDSNTRILLGSLLTHLNLSINYQVQLIDYLIDISHAKQTFISDLLNSNEIKAVLEDENINIPQKAKSFMNTLRNMRYPVISQAEKDFHVTIARIPLPKGVRIKHPPFFEAPGFTAEISFQDGTDLRSKTRLIAEQSEIENIKVPWKKHDEQDTYNK